MSEKRKRKQDPTGEALTVEEIALLNAYLTELEEHAAKEPPHLPTEVWDKVWPIIQETGEVPEEYRDRIGVSEIIENGEPKTGYYDIALEQWNKETRDIERKYRGVIIKALRFVAANGELAGSMLDVIRGLIDDTERGDLPKIKARRLEKIDFPVDKVNNNIWRMLKSDTRGQLQIRIGTEKKGTKPLDVIYCIDFSQLKDVSISKQLDAYDKRVYAVISGRFNEGHDYMTIQQIYNDMGHSGRPGASDIKKINDSITKMSGAWIVLNNEMEAAAYEYPLFQYDGSLLPMERVRIFINGQAAESAIHLFREPPLISFARGRKQITTVAQKLLASPLNKTVGNIELEDYLIEEISRIKNGKRNAKILYKTIYEKLPITSEKQRQRTPAKVIKLLDHYKKEAFISDYTVTPDKRGFIIKY